MTVKEVKIILDYLKNNTFIPDETGRKYKILHSDEVRKLLDYITNLQQEIERLNNIIEEQDKELELERKSRQLLTDDLANVCKMSLKKDNIIEEIREYTKHKIVECYDEGSTIGEFYKICDIDSKIEELLHKGSE